MRGRRTWRARGRLRAATAVLFAVAAIAEARTALAEARDRAVRVWVETVESSAAALATAVPVPHAVAAEVSSPAAVPTVPRPSARASRAFAPVELDADERLDLVRGSFCPEAARRLCRARARCGCVYDVPDCETRLERACTDELYETFQSQEESYELDPVTLDRCLDAFADLPTHCVLSAAIVPGCMWPIRDVADRGAACRSAGGPCRGGFCMDDLACSEPPRAGAPPVQGFCPGDLVELGGACVPSGRIGSACTEYRQCAGGLYDCTDDRCTPRPGAGAECNDDYGCAPGLRCEDRSCRPAPTWCQMDVECGSEQECTRPPMACVPCAPDLVCEGSVRCDDGSTCPEGRQCAEQPNGRCGSTVCRVLSLERLFEDLR